MISPQYQIVEFVVLVSVLITRLRTASLCMHADAIPRFIAPALLGEFNGVYVN